VGCVCAYRALRHDLRELLVVACELIIHMGQRRVRKVRRPPFLGPWIGAPLATYQRRSSTVLKKADFSPSVEWNCVGALAKRQTAGPRPSREAPQPMALPEADQPADAPGSHRKRCRPPMSHRSLKELDLNRCKTVVPFETYTGIEVKLC
jgi:hypothetical protein